MPSWQLLACLPWAVNQLKSRGIVIPDEISVMGYDNISLES